MIYQITADQRKQLMTALYDDDDGIKMYQMLQSLAPVDAQPLGDLTGVRECCGEYTKCFRPCTPRGRWEAEHTYTPLLRELSDSEIDAVWKSCQDFEARHIYFARAVLKAAGGGV